MSMDTLNKFQRINPTKLQQLDKGVEMLSLWIDQLLLDGIISLSTTPNKLEEISVRMVDSGLAGIARKIRSLPEKINKQKDWILLVAETIAELIHFTEAYKSNTKTNYHPEDILAYAGINLPKKDITTTAPEIIDSWIFIGSHMEKEENLTIIRSWFIGRTSNKLALFIDFQVGRFNTANYYLLNHEYQDACYFYPSATPLRITSLSKERSKRLEFFSIGQVAYSLTKALDLIAHHTSINPWINHQVYILSSIRFAIHDDQLYLCDKNDRGLICINKKQTWMQLISCSSNAQVYFIAEYFYKSWRILSMFDQDRFVTIIN